jgi:hypothetical protein
LHAAELWVETLVAQNTIATIGGRIIVCPTTKLSSDFIGTSLLVNSDFETLATPPLRFRSWTQVDAGGRGGSGGVFVETTNHRSGSAAAQMVDDTGGGLSASSYVFQTVSACESKFYNLSFWSRADGGGSDGFYYVYDASNSAYIVNPTHTSASGTSYENITNTFKAPVGCSSVLVALTGACAAMAASVYYDDVSLDLVHLEVEHSEMATSDIAYMEASGQVEFMKINTPASGAGPYSYTVVRDLDGTGANDWYAGDAVANLGKTGDGFIDLYSVGGVGASATTTGPTIVGNVRNDLTYNNWNEHWAIGNLDGLYGYGSTTYGVGLGKYSASTNYITIDATDGIQFYEGGGDARAQLSASVWTMGATTTEHIDIQPASLLFKDGGTTYASISGSAFTMGPVAGGEYVDVRSTGIKLYGNAASTISLDSSGNATFGEVSGSQGNMYWNAANQFLEFRGGTGGTVVEAYIDTDGNICAGSSGAKQAWINSGGFYMVGADGTFPDKMMRLMDSTGTTNYGYVYLTTDDSSYHTLHLDAITITGHDSGIYLDIQAPEGSDEILTVNVGHGGALYFDNATGLMVNDTANANMTLGLLVNQGANDDEILAFKSSDVGHGLTAITETDTYALMKKYEAAAGGLRLDALKDADGNAYGAVQIRGFLKENVNTTHGNTGRAIIELWGHEASGTDYSNTVANGNIFMVGTRYANANYTRFIIDAEGDVFADAAVSASAYDVGRLCVLQRGCTD